jgi:hypothetical protein
MLLLATPNARALSCGETLLAKKNTALTSILVAKPQNNESVV